MSSPVMKLARSDATKRMGPAISSAVAARPRGITVEAIFWPALVSSTGTDISVAAQPGATEFTRILCRACGLDRRSEELRRHPLLVHGLLGTLYAGNPKVVWIGINVLEYRLSVVSAARLE